MIRIFDLTISFFLIIILFPLLIIVSILIVMESKGGIFFKQIRVGKNSMDFKLYKFRTMYVDSEDKSQLTKSTKDPRITKMGYFLRKYKIDELPQIFNVILGEMSFVGPRPEVRRYVDLYSESQLKVLTVLPGLTDFASIEYIDESELLSQSDDPEQLYCSTIMPEKIKLNMKFINNQSVKIYFLIIWKTIKKIINL
ncbi:MAG: sugar transferase [Bacteroidales bacterium]|nr:sugar transferase [Bacteroidales bacterium]